MILLHARGFFRSVLSTGSQHFLYMTQGGSCIETGNYIFFELGGENKQPKKYDANYFLAPHVLVPSLLFLPLFFLVVAL